MAITQPGPEICPEVRYGASGQVLREWARINGALVTPTAPTLTILKPGGAATAIAAVVPTISSSQLTYTLDASSTSLWPLAMDYVAQWTFTADGEVHTKETAFDVVLRVFGKHIPITVDHLKNADPQIDGILSQASMSTDAHQRFIIPAWEVVYAWLRSHDRRPYCISDPRQLMPVTKAKALELFCRAVHRAPNDRWLGLADEYADQYREAQATTALRYDESQTRNVEAHLGFQQPEVSTGPTFGARAGTADWRARIGSRPA